MAGAPGGGAVGELTEEHHIDLPFLPDHKIAEPYEDPEQVVVHNETMQMLLDSDEKLATAVAEIKRLNAEVFLLKQSRDGAMNRANELTEWVKKRDSQIKKLKKELEALKRGAA